MVKAAHGIDEALFREFRVGRGTLDCLLNASVRVLHSERKLHGKDANWGLSLERAWIQSRVISDVNKARYEAGREPFKAYAESRYFCLQTEIELAQARAKMAKTGTPR